jgi:hypothetical protein
VAQVGHNKTLWIVGDSVSRQFFAALSCLLERATGLPPRLLEAPRDRASIPAVLLDKKGYVHKLSKPGINVNLFDVPQCILVPTATHPDGHCTVCYVWSTYSFEGLPILQRIGVDRTETVVLNWGLHTKYTKHPARDLEALLSGWRKFCRTRDGRCARLVWRETSAQHFGTAGGLYSKGAHQPCVAHNVSDYSHNNKLNLEVEDTLAAYPEVLKLPVWKLTADRFDAHPAHARYRDCTHWCAHHPPESLGRGFAWLRESSVGDLIREPGRRTQVSPGGARGVGSRVVRAAQGAASRERSWPGQDGVALGPSATRASGWTCTDSPTAGPTTTTWRALIS